MRVTIELEVFGPTMDDIVADATKQWQEFINDHSAVLPHDTEISVERHAGMEYKGVVYVRRKIENND